MTHALLICGDEERFQAHQRLMRDHLVAAAAVKRTALLSASEYGSGLIGGIERALGRVDPDEQLLLHYAGHGNGDGWSPGFDLDVHYTALARFIVGRPGATMIVNSCCHSGAFTEALQSAGADPERVGIITSADTKEVSFGRLTRSVVSEWSIRETYQPVHQDIVHEYAGSVFGFEWEEKTIVGENGVTTSVIRFHDKSTLLERLQDRMRIFKANRNPEVTRMRETRWGAVHDHRYFSKQG